MSKDIMKNDKVVDDWEQGRQQGRPPSKVKPTTDIDEVRKIFEETFTATNEDAADLYDDIWNFFEPYLKGGE